MVIILFIFKKLLNNMSYRNTKRTYGSEKGYQKLYFIETPTRVYGPWHNSPKARLKQMIKEGENAQMTKIAKFEYNPETEMYVKEYIPNF
jgi:hypothetical protein